VYASSASVISVSVALLECGKCPGSVGSELLPRPPIVRVYESGMAQCNASTARSINCKTTTKDPPLDPKLRGLDLLKSCAKFYENSVGVATPTVRPLRPWGRESKGPASSKSKWSIGTLALTLSFLLLPSFGITMMWGDFVREPDKKPSLTVASATAVGSQPAPGITTTLDLTSKVTARGPSNEQPEIIVHKVKTEPIAPQTFSPDPNMR
jgi:hypothetical protein